MSGQLVDGSQGTRDKEGGISVRLTTKRTPQPGRELKPETKRNTSNHGDESWVLCSWVLMLW